LESAIRKANIVKVFCAGGGLAAVIYVDVVQVFIMIAGSSVVLYRGLDKVGGWGQLQEK
jgi:SSS family solute:Na+ symporter